MSGTHVNLKPNWNWDPITAFRIVDHPNPAHNNGTTLHKHAGIYEVPQIAIVTNL